MFELNTISLFYTIVAVVVFILLLSKKIMENELWRATMTPLASIIGSGFLIAAPLLNNLAGSLAPVLMIVLCIISYAIGEIIRWNISNIENIHTDKTDKKSIKIQRLDSLSDWALGAAYVLSITYYLSLFSSFALKAVHVESEFKQNILTTIILWAIALFGAQRGLSSLEKVEGISVNLKLSIIFAFILGLFVFYIKAFNNQFPEKEILLGIDQVQVTLGLLIMVQGFETSRYLGEKYSQQVRIKSMRYSQLLSSFIYFIFIILFIPVFDLYPLVGDVTETSVIGVSQNVFLLAPYFLIFAAIASQLSAAVADTGGAGGLFNELSQRRISTGKSYLIIASLGSILVWGFDIFTLINFASKAFAFYYFVQCLTSAIFYKGKNNSRFLFSVFIFFICLAVIVFGRSFE